MELKKYIIDTVEVVEGAETPKIQMVSYSVLGESAANAFDRFTDESAGQVIYRGDETEIVVIGIQEMKDGTFQQPSIVYWSDYLSILAKNSYMNLKSKLASRSATEIAHELLSTYGRMVDDENVWDSHWEPWPLIKEAAEKLIELDGK